MKKAFLSIFMIALVLLMAFSVASCKKKGDATTTEAPKTWKVTFMEADQTVLKTVEVKDGEKVAVPTLTKEGYQVSGYYATPALLLAFDFDKPITKDTAVFVAWESTKVDDRKWEIAGSLQAYLDNNWGRAEDKTPYFLKKVDGKFNTFEITISLYTGDLFKIAVIDEEYTWTYDINAKLLVVGNEEDKYMGSEEAGIGDAKPNVKVFRDGEYRLTLVTDAETLELCKISYERLGDPVKEKPKAQYNMSVHSNFVDPVNWSDIMMTRNGDDYKWYVEVDVPAGGGQFGIKNTYDGGWWNLNGQNIELEEGHYMIWFVIKDIAKDITAADNYSITCIKDPAFYVVGTCGTMKWAEGADAANTAYRMEKQADGSYKLTVTFTEADTDTWTDGKAAVKVAYGGSGMVANEHWYSNAGTDNMMVELGEHTITITFDADGAATVTID